MIDFFEQLEGLKETMAWEPERKAALKQQLLVAMREQPKRSDRGGVFLAFVRSVHFRVMFASTLIAILIFVGAGVSFAAQSSLPGDVLYPVKVSVNEPVRSLFAVSAQAKADLDLQFAQARLEEADKLAVSGRLSDSVRQNLETKLESHVSSLGTHLIELQAKDGDAAAASVASDLETSFVVQSSILANLKQDKGDASSVGQFESTVKTQLDTARDGRTKFETTLKGTANSEASLKNIAQAKLDAAQAQAFTADGYISKLNLSKDSEDAARGRLELARQIVRDGQDKFSAGYYGEAFSLAIRAQRTITEARDLAKAQTDLKVDLHLENSDSFKVKGVFDRRSNQDKGRAEKEQGDQNSGKDLFRMRFQH